MEEEAEEAGAEEEDEAGAEEDEEQDQEQEQGQEEDTAEEEEDLGVPAIWQRGPSRLSDRPIPLEHRPVLRPYGKR